MSESWRYGRINTRTITNATSMATTSHRRTRILHQCTATITAAPPPRRTCPPHHDSVPHRRATRGFHGSYTVNHEGFVDNVEQSLNTDQCSHVCFPTCTLMSLRRISRLFGCLTRDYSTRILFAANTPRFYRCGLIILLRSSKSVRRITADFSRDPSFLITSLALGSGTQFC